MDIGIWWIKMLFFVLNITEYPKGNTKAVSDCVLFSPSMLVDVSGHMT